MKFSGEIRIPELDHPGVPAAVLIEGNQLEVVLEGESLGRWSLYDVQARRLISAAFSLELDGEELTFIADEPIDFAYRGVEKMAEVWARYKTMQAPRRLIAVRASRKGSLPSRVGELREAMEANLKASRSPSILAPPSPAEPAAEPEAAREIPMVTTPEPTLSSIEVAALDAERLAILEDKRRLEEERAHFEAMRAEAERQDNERIEAYRLEMARLEAERANAELTEAERADAYRLEMERLQQERAALQRMTEEHRLREDDQTARNEALRQEMERIESERLEMERIESERASAAEAAMASVSARQAELERLEAERAEAERAELQRLEAERIALERLEAERSKAARAELDRVEAQRLEAENREMEPLEAVPTESDSSVTDAVIAGEGGRRHRRKSRHDQPAEELAALNGAHEKTSTDEAVKSAPSKELVVDLGVLEVPDPEPALAGVTREKSGLKGSVRSAFSRSRNHEHVFVPAPGGIGISRSICNECGYVSISSSD